jgi:hypothetical protein
MVVMCRVDKYTHTYSIIIINSIIVVVIINNNTSISNTYIRNHYFRNQTERILKFSSQLYRCN